MPRITGTCWNCLRPGMSVNNALGTGICGSCAFAIQGTKPGSPEREAKLKEAAEKYAGKPKRGVGRKKKEKVEGSLQKTPRKGAVDAGSQLQDAPKVGEVPPPKGRLFWPLPPTPLPDRHGKTEVRTCRVCGCTDARACEGGCSWIEKDLCSAHAKENQFETIFGASIRGQSYLQPAVDLMKTCIILSFETEADRKLLEAIETAARHFRRTPDQQILWMCQSEMDLQDELIKEAAK